MHRISTFILFTFLAASAVADEKSREKAAEKPAKSRIASIGLFKNGLAIVHRQLAIDGAGVYRVDDIPEPVHGTYWVESSAKIVTRLTRRVVDVPAQRLASGNFQEELAGREVVVHFAQQGLPPASGTVAAMAPPQGNNAWSRSYQQPRYYSYPGEASGPQVAANRMLVLTSEAGSTYIDPAKIAYVEAKGAFQMVRQRKPVMLIEVPDGAAGPTNVSISYLTKGMAWAPSYRVDLSDPKTLSLRQKAVIKNELESFDGADVRLISGFPSVKFAHVVSPLSLDTNWTSFFQQLNQRVGPSNAAMSNVVSQQVAFNSTPDSGVDLTAIPTGDSVDLSYQDIGRQSLDEGDSLALETASATAAYDRIVEWIVPDTRRDRWAYGQQQDGDGDENREGAWDAVRFRNPLTFPMTTGPAMIVAGDRFNGQQMSYWVNPGEETTLHVTKALSIRTRSTEQEVGNRNDMIYVGGTRYSKVTVQGELRANNHRKEAVTMIIRRRFSGDLVSADQSPKQTLLEEGVYSVNKLNQLLWNVTLKPGEETVLNYRYTLLVQR